MTILVTKAMNRKSWLSFAAPVAVSCAVDYVEKHPCVGQVRHIGLFSAIELVKDKETREPLVPFGKDPEGIMPKIIGMLKADGFWTYSHENMVLITPPLIITEEQLKEELAKVDKVLDAVDAMI